MIDIDSISLDSLPALESDDLEYKSSLIDENKLKREIQNAASAFWNSGGGAFLAGVNDSGVVDGGIFRNVGRQTLEDWLAQVIQSVFPQGKYAFRIFDHTSHGKIGPDKCVLALAFATSTGTPHQSADYRYYMRAGAHTVPAPHFIVEALYAKRHFRSPRLVYTARVSTWTTGASYLHLEVIAATDPVALDVEIDLDPLPKNAGLQFPLKVPIIDREHPFAFRFEVPIAPPFISNVKIVYRDFADACYSYEKQIDPAQFLSDWDRDTGEIGAIAERIRELTSAVERIGHAFR